MSALADAQTQRPLVSSNTQAPPKLPDVLSCLECELNDFQSAIKSPKACAAALATVEQDIDAVKRLMLSILTRRNTLVPIFIFPAEVLSRIFHFVAFSEKPYSLGWAHVTHVCRRWRQIALDDSTLWTHFSTTSSRNKEWIAERLSRARNAPLVIEIVGSMEKAVYSLLLGHISHMRELHLRNLSPAHWEIVQAINTHKAPALEHLELSANTSPIVGDSLFKGPLPKLQILCLSQIIFPWSRVPRGQLTQLKVTLTEEVPTITSKDSQNDDLKQLIGLMVDCPLLEVLTLENCLPAKLSESSAGQTIHLPRLSRLCLGGSSSRITNLLKMLKLSSSATLRLQCTSENTATHNDHEILPFLSAHFNCPIPVEFRSFKITVDDVGRVIAVTASTSLPISPVNHTGVLQDDSDAELSLSFHRILDVNTRVDILR